MGQTVSISKFEWAAVTLFTSALLFLILVSHYKTAAPLIPLSERLVEVVVSGEVEYPGTYTLPLGSSVTDLEPLVHPLPQAIPKKRVGSAPLKEGERIVFVDPRVTVTIRGAVCHPVTLQLPRGSRVGEYFAQIPFTQEADLEKLAAKKIIRQGQVIHVSTKSKNDSQKSLP